MGAGGKINIKNQVYFFRTENLQKSAKVLFAFYGHGCP
jgi:hypothetical protein